MNLRASKKLLEFRKEQGYKIKMITHPYNVDVIKVIYFKENNTEINYIDEFFIGGLTNNTKNEILKLADEYEHGIFW